MTKKPASKQELRAIAANALKKLSEQEKAGFHEAIKEKASKETKIREERELKEEQEAKEPSIGMPKTSKVISASDLNILKEAKEAEKEVGPLGGSPNRAYLQKRASAILKKHTGEQPTGPEYVELINELVNVMGGGIAGVSKGKQVIKSKSAKVPKAKVETVDLGMIMMPGLPPIKVKKKAKTEVLSLKDKNKVASLMAKKKQLENTYKGLAEGVRKNKLKEELANRNIEIRNLLNEAAGEQGSPGWAERMMKVREEASEALEDYYKPKKSTLKPVGRYKSAGFKAAGERTKERAAEKRAKAAEAEKEEVAEAEKEEVVEAEKEEVVGGLKPLEMARSRKSKQGVLITVPPVKAASRPSRREKEAMQSLPEEKEVDPSAQRVTEWREDTARLKTLSPKARESEDIRREANKELEKSAAEYRHKVNLIKDNPRISPREKNRQLKALAEEKKELKDRASKEGTPLELPMIHTKPKKKVDKPEPQKMIYDIPEDFGKETYQQYKSRTLEEGNKDLLDIESHNKMQKVFKEIKEGIEEHNKSGEWDDPKHLGTIKLWDYYVNKYGSAPNLVKRLETANEARRTAKPQQTRLDERFLDTEVDVKAEKRTPSEGKSIPEAHLDVDADYGLNRLREQLGVKTKIKPEITIFTDKVVSPSGEVSKEAVESTLLSHELTHAGPQTYQEAMMSRLTNLLMPRSALSKSIEAQIKKQHELEGHTPEQIAKNQKYLSSRTEVTSWLHEPIGRFLMDYAKAHGLPMPLTPETIRNVFEHIDGDITAKNQIYEKIFKPFFSFKEHTPSSSTPKHIRAEPVKTLMYDYIEKMLDSKDKELFQEFLRHVKADKRGKAAKRMRA